LNRAWPGDAIQTGTISNYSQNYIINNVIHAPKRFYKWRGFCIVQTASKEPNTKFHFLGVLAFLLVGCQTVCYQDPIRTEDQILGDVPNLEADIMARMKGFDVKAASIAIVTSHRVEYVHAFGAPTDGTFQAASISKTLSAYAALRLVEQGKLDLDTPLSGYLQEKYFPVGSHGNVITLRMVLNHTSGLSNDATGRDRRLYHKPGEAFHYSGAGFAYLTKVIESITRLPFDVYMEQSVLLPLGMTHSRFSIRLPNGTKAVSAAYSLVTTPADVGLFFLELLDPMMISEALAEQMRSDSVKINRHYSWGLGVGIQHGNDDTAIWNWGNNENYYKSLVVFFLKSGTGVVIMTKGKNGDKIYQDIAHEAIGGSYYGLERSVLSAR